MERANDVFVHQKRRERAITPRVLRRIGSTLLDVLVGYGRASLRAFYGSAVFVALGYFVFRRRDGMVPQRPEDASHYYSPFWYSVDLLVPVIDLHATHVWMPRHDRPFAQIYMRVHRLAGWFLIPIGVAAVTGLIK